MTIDLSILGLKKEFSEAADLLAELPEEILCAPVPIEEYSAIGVQFRHVINYGDILVNNWRTGVVDFTGRDRNKRLETDKDFMMERIGSFQRSLDVFNGYEADMPLKQIFLPLEGGGVVERKTSLGSAIDFVSFHVNHHVPLIVCLAYIQGIEIEQPCGIAPDTPKAKGRHLS